VLNILYTIKHVQLYYEHELLVLIADTVVYCILLKTTLQQSTCNVQYSNKRKDTTLMEHFQNPIEISSRGKIDTHNTQILNIIKTKVLFPHACVTLADFGYPADGLWFTCSKKIISLFF
jgi:hypothetical protein